MKSRIFDEFIRFQGNAMEENTDKELLYVQPTKQNGHRVIKTYLKRD